jgi:hypothetical protein
MSYKSVLVPFDFIDFASKLVYQRGQGCRVQVAPIYSQTVMHNAAGQNGASKIGTFVCRSNPRDTKASKRAKILQNY